MLALNRIGQGAAVACLLGAATGSAACKSAPVAAIKLHKRQQQQQQQQHFSSDHSTCCERSHTGNSHHNHHHHRKPATQHQQQLNLRSGVERRYLSSAAASPASATKDEAVAPQQQNGQSENGSGQVTKPAAVYSDYETLEVSSPIDRVLHIQLNRPTKRNALNRQTLQELQSVFRTIHEDKRCRAVVISGNGKDFSAGLDHSDIEKILHEITSNQGITLNSDVARRGKFLRNLLSKYQETFNMIERCAKPVIVSVHGACLGAALNLICCADVRFCTQDSFFQLKDISAGMMADMGVLQRMPKVVGSDSWMRELALSARRSSAAEAKEYGLVSRVFEDQQHALNGALEMAASITKMSPVAVQGTKLCMNYSRDHTVNDGLTWALNWNMGMLQSDDLLKAMKAVGRKHDMPEFDDM